MVDGFPDTMMLMGPHPALGNIPRSIEYGVDWITGLIRFARDNLTRLGATAAGVNSWTDHVKAIGRRTSLERSQFMDDRHQLQRRRQADPHHCPLQRQRSCLPRPVRRGCGEGV
jgi:hypothetical protein